MPTVKIVKKTIMKEKIINHYNGFDNNPSTTEGIGFVVLRWCIAIFTIASTFNPSVNGLTLYLWFPLMCLDKDFIIALVQKINLRICILYLAFIFCCLISFKIGLAVKVTILFLGVTYLVLIGNRILKKIYICFLISAFFCIIQFITYFYSPELAYQLGPGSIGEFIWGEYATLTYTNQYVVFLFPRMSGLSREAGFFVSLLFIVFLIRVRYGKLTLIEKMIFLLGFLFSLSKVSLLIFIIPIVFLVKNIINKIPIIIFLSLIFAAYCIIANHLNIGSTSYFFDNESIAHRLSSAYLLFHMDENYFFTGCSQDYNCFTSEGTALVNYLVNDRNLLPSIGFIGLIIDFGFLGILLIFISIITLKLNNFTLLLLIIFTLTVNILTMDNFIILLYYYLLTYDKKGLYES